MFIGSFVNYLTNYMRLIRCKRYLLNNFRNGDEIFRSYIENTECNEAVWSDGTVIRHPQGRIGFAPMILEVCFDQVYTNKFYQPQPGDTVIDAGANIGLFSLTLARAEPNITIFSFEPFGENFNYLKQNIESTGVSNVRVYQAGLSKQKGEGVMIDGGNRSQDHQLKNITNKDCSCTLFQTFGLNDVLSLTSSEKIALFKCDIEGSEYDLFSEADQDDIERVVRYAIEYHDNIRTGTLDILRNRFVKTHKLNVYPAGNYGYGMLYASLR